MLGGGVLVIEIQLQLRLAELASKELHRCRLSVICRGQEERADEPRVDREVDEHFSACPARIGGSGSHVAVDVVGSGL